MSIIAKISKNILPHTQQIAGANGLNALTSETEIFYYSTTGQAEYIPAHTRPLCGSLRLFFWYWSAHHATKQSTAL